MEMFPNVGFCVIRYTFLGQAGYKLKSVVIDVSSVPRKLPFRFLLRSAITKSTRKQRLRFLDLKIETSDSFRPGLRAPLVQSSVCSVYGASSYLPFARVQLFEAVQVGGCTRILIMTSLDRRTLGATSAGIPTTSPWSLELQPFPFQERTGDYMTNKYRGGKKHPHPHPLSKARMAVCNAIFSSAVSFEATHLKKMAAVCEKCPSLRPIFWGSQGSSRSTRGSVLTY